MTERRSQYAHRVERESEIRKVIVKPSPIHGKGVFAAVGFKAGDRILRRDDSRLVTDESPLAEGEWVYHCVWIADGRVVYVQEPERNAGRGGSRTAPTAEPLRIRIGLNAGEPIAEEADLFGTAVILAARIAAKAQGGEILASEGVRQIVAGKRFLLSDRGETALRGFEDPVRLYEVSWREDA